MLASLIEYEWVLFFGLVMAVALVDLVRTRRSLRAQRPPPADSDGKDGRVEERQSPGD